MDYTAPELTRDDEQIAQRKARELFRKYGIAKAIVIITMLCLENRRLFLEVNDHRVKRGIAPLEEKERWA